MNFVSDVLTPIIQLLVYVFMICGVLFFIFYGIKKVFPNWKWSLKYVIFRKKYKEDDVEWCVDAIERGMKPFEVKKFLLLNHQSIKRTSEITYIFNKINNKLKGGVEDGRKHRQSVGEYPEKKIPSYEREGKK